MLIEFSVGNYLSFRDRMILTMAAAPVRRSARPDVFPADKDLSLLKCAVIYGANASGKSNLFRAMAFMRHFALNSFRETGAHEEINAEPFRLSSETENMPSVFEIIFVQDGIRYRYGFEADHLKVHAEWLFHVPETKEAKLFVREGTDFEIGNHFGEGKGLETKTRNNALFLSVSAQFNGRISGAVLKWFGNFDIISGFEDYTDMTIKYMEKGGARSRKIDEFLTAADLGILSASIDKTAGLPKDIPRSVREALKNGPAEARIKTSHHKHDKNRKIVGSEHFGLQENESKGAQKIFSLAGPVLTALDIGKTLVIDEMDAGLHPLITGFLIQLFRSGRDNPNNAQLIFNTHNTFILNTKNFGRDQIWFAEKDRYGATDLYPLLDYKAANHDSHEQDYILGRYGAIPYIDTDGFRPLLSPDNDEGQSDE